MNKLAVDVLLKSFGIDLDDEAITVQYGHPYSPSFDYQSYERDMNSKVDEMICIVRELYDNN